MIGKLRNWLPVVPLLLLLGGTYWLNLQVQPDTSRADSNLRHDPDYIVDNFTATTLDENGKINHVMSAKKMWHYPDDDSTHLETPELQSFSEARPPVRISALTGEITRKGDEVFLRKEVILVRPAFEKASELIFNTSYLHIVPNKNKIETDQPITMTDASTRINAVGMILDNKAHTIQFLSNVKVEYVPAKK
jgi:lipopolysaccharide export system protein LptC